ncbi:MAG: hypothetical protein DMG01_10530 [Acidobacteria bacterium]|nr:MAG: hypothetical protein DMG01_10530 [Acidobacteriota bacterium]
MARISRRRSRGCTSAFGRTRRRDSLVARAAAPSMPEAPKAALVEAPPPMIAPSLKLVGLAEDDGPDGAVRSAIISGDGELFIVKVGDSVTARYVVTTIGADVVELTDVTDHTIRRLPLR